MTWPRRSWSRDPDAALRRFIARLARPPRAPDLSASILDRVNRHRPFVSARGRRRVRLIRVAPAACVLLVLASIAAMQRAETRRLGRSDGSVVSAVVCAGQTEMARGAAEFSGALAAAARRWIGDLSARATLASRAPVAPSEGMTRLTLDPGASGGNVRAPLWVPGGSGGVDALREPSADVGARPLRLVEASAPPWLWPWRMEHAMAYVLEQADPHRSERLQKDDGAQEPHQ